MNSPLPQDLGAECRKAAKIIESFINPGSNSVDSIIPPWVITNAKGIAILTVIKAGFLFSGRAGSGLVVARLDDGSWSAPSAISTAGMGVGGQIGAELTDFVIILNTRDAVKAFSYGGNVTLGGNLSVAAGPIGRNAEAAGTVGKLSAIFSYSKTRGLFAGVSVEGTVILERKEANQNFYRRKASAKEILKGEVPPPASCEALYRALNRRVEEGAVFAENQYDDEYEDRGTFKLNSRKPNKFDRNNSKFERSNSKFNRYDNDDDYEPVSSSNSKYKSNDRDFSRKSSDYGGLVEIRSSTTTRRPPPPPPSRAPTAVALYDFDGERDDDLPFRKGDVIVIIEKSDSQDDWWTGRCNGRSGQFPANYVQLN